MGKKLLLGCGLPLIAFFALAVMGARVLFKPEVKTERSETVQRGDVEIKVVETGTIQPLHKVEVKSKVGGRIEQMTVEEGAIVHEGQVLARIDPIDINTQVAALRAQAAGAKARMEAAKKTLHYQKDQTTTSIEQYVHNVAVTMAHLREAQAQADVQPKLTQQAIDVAQANLEAARSNLKAQQDLLNLMLNSTQPNAVVSAQAAYDQAKSQADNMLRNYQRQQQLLKKGFVSQQIVDQAQTDWQVAQSHLRDVKEPLDRIQQTNKIQEENQRSLVAAARGQASQQEAALAQAKTAIDPLIKNRELESARAAYAQAKAQLASAQSGRTQDLEKQDEAIAAEADYQNIKNQLDAQLVHLHDTTIIASMSGIVTKKYSEAGELIESAIDSFGSGTSLYQISDLSTMLIKMNVNEVDVSKLMRGMLTEVTIDAERGVKFLGRVRKVAPAALSDATATATGSGSSSASSGTGVVKFPIEIQVDHADRRLKPGMSARCAVIVARRKNVLRLPTNCVSGEDASGTVQVVTTEDKDGQKVEKTTPRAVTIGLRGDSFVEILSGLKEGEKVRPVPFNGPERKAIDLDPGDDNNRRHRD